MRIILILVGIATVIAVVKGSEYLMKLAKKQHLEDSEKHKGAIDKEIDDYQKSAENINKIKEKLNNQN